MQRAILFLFVVLIFGSVSSQVLKGKILSTDKVPIPFTTIYIKELTSGIAADEQGEFQMKMNPGTYTLLFRSIGYETQQRNIVIPPSGLELTIILAEKTVELDEVLVKPSKEDPANRVMRQAIARAPYHLNQIASYDSENYMKGSAKIEKLPGLMKSMIKDKKILSLVGKLLVLESQSLVSYQSPSKYTQKVVAFKSSIPKEMQPKGGLRISTSSIYESNFMDYISPLSSGAFSYYKFRLENIFTSGQHQINKVKITPKYKNNNLFSGYLYIVEGEWSVYDADLTANEMGTISRYKINYQEVQPSVFLPVTFDMNADIATLGVKGYAKFYSSTKYKNIRLNASANLIKNRNLNTKSVQPVTKKQKKALDEMEKLSGKEKLSTLEAVKLSKLMTAATEPEEKRKERESLEIKKIEKIKMEVDSLAERRDSLYWDSIRNVPLRLEEIESFKYRDTLAPSKNVTVTDDAISIGVPGNSKMAWLMGGSVKLNENSRLFYDGLLRGLLKEYNFVDGAWLGQRLTLSMGSTEKGILTISPSAYYVTARKTVIWDVSTNFKYKSLNNGLLSLKIGNTTDDIQKNKGVSRFYNSLSSLFFGDNVIRFYQKKFLSVENSVDVINGLRLTTGVGFENRILWNNQTEYHFFGKNPQPNYPDQAYSDAFPEHSTTSVWLGMQYTPRYRYRIDGNRKYYVSSKYPTFTLMYRKAFPLLKNNIEQSSYDKISFSVNQSIKLSAFDNLDYQVNTGVFLTKKKLYAPDYQYFSVNPLFVNDKSFNNTFNFPENYTFTADKWLETHVNWKSDYLLLKRIGFLQTLQFNEALHLHSLWLGGTAKPYIEGGYSIGFGNMVRVGAFTGFTGFNFYNAGIKISLPIFSFGR